MNEVILLIVLGIIMWILNFIFGMIQIKDFNKNYSRLRRKGRVAIGKKRGYLQAGTVVMFLIDDRGNILHSVKMHGVSVFARFKSFNGLEGINLGDITQNILGDYNKYIRYAILDAVNNYNTFKGGDAKEGV